LLMLHHVKDSEIV